MRLRFNQVRKLLLICVSIGLCSCVFPTQNIRDAADWKQVISSGNKSVVFGRIEWLEQGKDKKIDTIFGPVVLNLLRMEDRSNSYGQVDENGDFIWALEPGTYFINKITYVRPFGGTHFIYPRAAFRIPDRSKTFYIGSLKVDFAVLPDRIGLVPTQVNIIVVDQGEVGYAATIEKLKLDSTRLEKSLLFQDKRLPETVDPNAESFMRAVNILNLISTGMAH